MSQVRLPGTLPLPAEARRMFRECRSNLERAQSDLAMAESDCSEHRKALKEAIMLESMKARAYADSEEVDVEREYWQTVAQVRAVTLLLAAARKTRSECRRIRDRRRGEYENAKAELEAVRRGQK